MKHMANQLERHMLRQRDCNQQSIESGLARMNEKDIMLTLKKFVSAYFVTKEELPLTKFKIILALEELPNVELGNAYHNNNICGEFIDYIANNLAVNFHSAYGMGQQMYQCPRKRQCLYCI